MINFKLILKIGSPSNLTEIQGCCGGKKGYYNTKGFKEKMEELALSSVVRLCSKAHKSNNKSCPLFLPTPALCAFIFLSISSDTYLHISN